MRKSLIVGLFFLLCLASRAFADGIHPAYLEIEEQENSNLAVVWKIPLYKGKPIQIKPIFPPGFKLASPRIHMKTGNAIVNRWVMAPDKIRLAGQKLCIEGLAATMTDVLVRVKLKDGFVHRVVLRPTETSTLVPHGESESTNGKKGFLELVLRTIDRMRYAILLAVSFALSLLPKARERGILLCTTALLAGALCGHSIHWISIPENFVSKDFSSKEDGSRILHGLLLNTYRAFVHREEDAIYDRLAKSVTGDLLSDVYLQNSRTMRIEEANGQTMIIDRLDIKSIDSIKPLEDGGFSILTNWDVYGSVRHWKHIHNRCNAYKAWVSIVPTKTYWKIFSIQLINEKRII
jgi:hypothetical protein